MTARGPEVRASSAQAAANADDITQYKKKIFYRRLKVILIGTTALGLLLAGCLLGFVLPATIHEKPSLGVNDSSRADPSSGPGPRIGPDKSLVVNKIENITQLHNHTHKDLTPRPKSQENVHSTTANAVVASTLRPSTKLTTKWWLVKIHDQLSEVKRKHAQYRVTNHPTSIKRQSVTPMQMPTSSDSPVNKWWLLHWREHVENALQKNSKKNNTTIVTPKTSAMLADSNTGSDDAILARFEEVKNNLPALRLSTQTSNVRQVTSYPKSNVTTTPPIFVTKKVQK